VSVYLVGQTTGVQATRERFNGFSDREH
jgi:hypothetical protein